MYTYPPQVYWQRQLEKKRRSTEFGIITRTENEKRSSTHARHILQHRIIHEGLFLGGRIYPAPNIHHGFRFNTSNWSERPERFIVKMSPGTINRICSLHQCIFTRPFTDVRPTHIIAEAKYRCRAAQLLEHNVFRPGEPQERRRVVTHIDTYEYLARSLHFTLRRNAVFEQGAPPPPRLRPWVVRPRAGTK